MRFAGNDCNRGSRRTLRKWTEGQITSALLDNLPTLPSIGGNPHAANSLYLKLRLAHRVDRHRRSTGPPSARCPAAGTTCSIPESLRHPGWPRALIIVVPIRLATIPSSPSTFVMYAKLAGAPPSTLPEGNIFHNTSPNPIMSAGFVITLYQSRCALSRPGASLKQPRRKIGRVLLPHCPNVGTRTLDPHVFDPTFSNAW